MSTFAELGVDPRIIGALDEAGITTPFPIQALTLPLALDGYDIIGQAKTGTGKTLGFGIPLLQAVDLETERAGSPPQALVVVPTRELAVQVADDLKQAGAKLGTRVLEVYGGRAIEPQISALAKGVDVVVGTPGRLLDLSGQKKLDLSQVKVLVLDEADQMLDLGFLPDVEKLLALTPETRQTMLFSATLPGAIVTLSRRHLRQPTQIRATDPDNDRATVEGVTQHVFRVHNLDKDEILARVLQSKDRGLTIVFCATKRQAKRATDSLQERGFAVGAVHGDLDQSQREQGLRAFRSGKVDVLIATDVAARGLDVEAVTHVVNYSCPKDPATYLHRIGRTARAGATGIAITFVDWEDLHRWGQIDKEHGLEMPDPPETYSTSPELFETLGIPSDLKGVLPRGQRVRAGLEAEKAEDLGGPPKRERSGERRDEKSGDRPRRSRSGAKDTAGSRDTAHGGDAAADTASDKPRRDRPPRSRTRRRGGETTEASVGATAEASSGGGGEGSEAAPRRSRQRRRSRGGSAGEATGGAES